MYNIGRNTQKIVGKTATAKYAIRSNEFEPIQPTNHTLRVFREAKTKYLEFSVSVWYRSLIEFKFVIKSFLILLWITRVLSSMNDYAYFRRYRCLWCIISHFSTPITMKKQRMILQLYLLLQGQSHTTLWHFSALIQTARKCQLKMYFKKLFWIHRIQNRIF